MASPVASQVVELVAASKPLNQVDWAKDGAMQWHRKSSSAVVQAVDGTHANCLCERQVDEPEVSEDHGLPYWRLCVRQGCRVA